MYKNTINATHPYPCDICKENPQKAILCSNCTHCQMSHVKCNGTPIMDYNQMTEYNSTLNDEEIENCEWLYVISAKFLKLPKFSLMGLKATLSY